jgi:hypothetical protein
VCLRLSHSRFPLAQWRSQRLRSRPMACLTCHLALCGLDLDQLFGVHDLDRDTVIASELFSMNYIPLKRTPEEAVQSALCVRVQQAMKAAVAPTEWWVLEVTLDAEQLCQLFLADTLRHARDRNGPGCFSFHGPLRLRNTAHFTVRRMVIRSTGLEKWARFFLKPSNRCLQAYANSRCASCRAPTVRRTASNFHGRQWCIECWHSFCWYAAPADLHTAAAIRGEMQGTALAAMQGTALAAMQGTAGVERATAGAEWDQVRNAVVFIIHQGG